MVEDLYSDIVKRFQELFSCRAGQYWSKDNSRNIGVFKIFLVKRKNIRNVHGCSSRMVYILTVQFMRGKIMDDIQNLLSYVLYFF